MTETLHCRNATASDRRWLDTSSLTAENVLLQDVAFTTPMKGQDKEADFAG